MGFMDELRKLTQPYDDEDDFFEGADVSFKPQPKPQPQAIPHEQALFESNFVDEGAAAPAAAPAQAPAQAPGRKFGFKGDAKAHKAPPAPNPNSEGSVFGNLGGKKPQKRERTVNFAGREAQVILFSPKTFDEAGEVVNHILQNSSVVMTLEGLPTDLARRLLDFISGIAFALQGKITPVSAKTYFITPQNVDIVGAQADGTVSDGQYF